MAKTKRDFSEMDQWEPMEVLREALRVIASCLDDDERTLLLFLESDPSLHLDGSEKLKSLGMVDADGILTPLGWSIARLILRDDPEAADG